MGMFDNLRCKAPLPGDPPKFVTGPDHLFQTKSLDCAMTTWDITADGRLVETSSPWFEGEDYQPKPLDDFTGSVEFYDGNGSGGAGGRYTPDGSDAEWVEYTAVFVDGKLQQIKEAARERHPALPVSMAPPTFRPAKPEEVARRNERESAPLLGRRLYVAYGGDGPGEGHWAEVVAESGDQICLKTVELGKQQDGRFFFERIGNLKVEHRCGLDRILFDSAEDAAASHQARIDQRKRETDEYDRLMRATGR